MRVEFTSSAFYIDSYTCNGEKSHMIINFEENDNLVTVEYFDGDINPESIKEEFYILPQQVIFSMRSKCKSIRDCFNDYLTTMNISDIENISSEYNNNDLYSVFFASILTYLSFIQLSNSENFSDYLPFNFSTVNAENSLNLNSFTYYSSVVFAFTQVGSPLLKQVSNFLQLFINIWSSAFLPGPIVSIDNHIRLSIEINSGMSNYYITKLSEMHINFINEYKDLVKTHKVVCTTDEKFRELINEQNNQKQKQQKLQQMHVQLLNEHVKLESRLITLNNQNTPEDKSENLSLINRYLRK